MVKLNKHRLIDLALTCAIFIILIASAFSAKQDYQYLSSRTAITKGLHFASLARIAVSKNIANKLSDACDGVNIETPENIKLRCHNGIIEATILTEHDPYSITLTMIPHDSGKKWTCTTSNRSRHVPEACRSLANAIATE